MRINVGGNGGVDGDAYVAAGAALKVLRDEALALSPELGGLVGGNTVLGVAWEPLKKLPVPGTKPIHGT